MSKKNIAFIKNNDSALISILFFAALVIGVYIIATTIMIADDGVGYINQARLVAKNPSAVIKTPRPMGYTFLIFAGHKIYSIFDNSNSIHSWIYSAQMTTLICRLLAITPLFFIGKVLVGSRDAFWGLLILILLPHPAEYGSDVLREWPHILFLGTALLLLIYGIGKSKWWLFALSGILAGFGHMIRPESAQIVIYAIIWLLVILLNSACKTSKIKATLLTMVLVAGFLIPTVPYVKARQMLLPKKLERVISSDLKTQNSINIYDAKHNSPQTAALLSPDTQILNAGGKLVQQLAENLVYFFLFPLAFGFYKHYKGLRQVLLDERLFILTLVIVYIIMMMLLYTNYGYISRRHCMPIVVFTVFYIPDGLRVIADWLFRDSGKTKTAFTIDRQRWFYILLLIGFGVCFLKLSRITPLRHEKKEYIEIANWLAENTKENDIIAFANSQPRIGFYAQRKTTTLSTKSNTLSASGITPDSWIFLAGTFDRLTQKLYINGRLAAEENPGFTKLNKGVDNFTIGKPYLGFKKAFKGNIGRVAIFQKAINNKDIVKIYKDPNNLEYIGSLIECWNFDNGGDVKGKMLDDKADFIALSGIRLSQIEMDEISVCAWVKSESTKHVNWICGNGRQFRIGAKNKRAFFWIRQAQPGTIVPKNAGWVILNEDESKLNFDWPKININNSFTAYKVQDL